MKSMIPTKVASPTGMASLWAWMTCFISSKSIVQTWNCRPRKTKSVSAPIVNARSPTRFTTNAFMPAEAFSFFSNQNPISRYEQRPTPSQPTNISRTFEAMTRMSMKPVNRLR